MITDLQDAAVNEVISLAPAGWAKILANVEIDEIAGECVVSPDVSVFIGAEEHQMRLRIDAVDSFKKLRRAMCSCGEAWNICDLSILNSGEYKYKFSLGEPGRLRKLN